MRALVIYESMYGNTHLIADAIAAGLAEADAAVETVPVGAATPDRLASAELVVVGGPTHIHGMSRASTRKAAVTVPERALAQGPRGTFVYVVDKDGLARMRQVTASQMVNQRWVIDSGVDDGDRVIVDGLPKVRPDQPVKAVEAPVAPAQQAPAAQAQS